MSTPFRLQHPRADGQPLRPADILGRLAVVAAIAVGFGFAAQLWAGVTG